MIRLQVLRLIEALSVFNELENLTAAFVLTSVNYVVISKRVNRNVFLF